MATQHQIKYSFFGSDHSNIEIVHNETHQALNLAQTATDTASTASKTAQTALNTAQTASDTAQAASNTSQVALNTSQTALDNVNAFGIRLDAFEAAQGASDGAGVVGDAAALVGDGTGVVGDAAALVGNAAETIVDSDRIMLGCTIAAAVAVTVMVGFVVFCFYQGIKHGKDEKEGERKSSAANSNTPSGKFNTEYPESFVVEWPNVEYCGAQGDLQPQQRSPSAF